MHNRELHHHLILCSKATYYVTTAKVQRSVALSHYALRNARRISSYPTDFAVKHPFSGSVLSSLRTTVYYAITISAFNLALMKHLTNIPIGGRDWKILTTDTAKEQNTTKTPNKMPQKHQTKHRKNTKQNTTKTPNELPQKHQTTCRIQK